MAHGGTSKGVIVKRQPQASDSFLDDPDVQARLRIMHAVDRSLDQITITELCARSGISRQTFYRLFSDKYSLHWWWPTFVHRFYLVEVGRTIDWETGYFHHIRLLSREKEFFHAATQYTLNISTERTVMPHFRKCAILETLQDYRHMAVDEALMFCVDSWVKTETEILTEWYRLGTVPEPEEAARLLTSIVPRRLYDALVGDCRAEGK